MLGNMPDVSVHDAQGVVTDLLEKLGGPNGRDWLSATKRFLRKEELRPAVERVTFTLPVNYGKSVEAALVAGGYDWTDPSLISSNFPRTRRRTDTVRLHLVHLNKVMWDDEVTRELEKLNLRDATIEELLALGANPATRDLQRQFPIVARGSVWHGLYGSLNVPMLWSSDRKRRADLRWIDGKWRSYYRFLAVSR